MNRTILAILGLTMISLSFAAITPGTFANDCSNLAAVAPTKSDQCYFDSTGLATGDKCCHVSYTYTPEGEAAKTINQCNKVASGSTIETVTAPITADNKASGLKTVCSATPAVATNTCSSLDKTVPTEAAKCTGDAKNLKEGEKCCYLTYTQKTDWAATGTKLAQCSLLTANADKTTLTKAFTEDTKQYSAVDVNCSSAYVAFSFVLAIFAFLF